ncbi:formimidoylglutamase [Pedobacter montanisoli]|uniref:Formimidoylglutamase n=1 Tax=Pedobacter montanisoli TaxID=2923277 RepID=A0ABS9ZT50_9SPHI|nr:formimidoylglutamase [Pedobacter montanisoli]MCJ0741769.1 formimidoylglutamase [Pedobacter montanisoli]
MVKFIMDSFKIYTQEDIKAHVKLRKGETKLGEKIQILNGSLSAQHLKISKARVVILGIPEDIGVRANYGVGGAKTAWQAFLPAFLNLQQNIFLNGEDILLLGHFEIGEPEEDDIESLRQKTAAIDELVSPVIETIVKAGKIPVIIGGGHNNAYPIISGTSWALSQKISVINIDAHTDLRDVGEGRHSGNGFSNAFTHKLLAGYTGFGIHQNYISESLINYSQNNPVKLIYFDDILSNDQSPVNGFKDIVEGLKGPCGLEIDLDSITGILASAATPSGFELNEVRKMILAAANKFCYLHLCEGALKLENGRTDLSIGKTLSYLVSDFIKALHLHNAVLL